MRSTRPPSRREPGNVANLLRGTPCLNVPITRTVFGVSGQCRVAVIDLKPIDRRLTITGLMTTVMPIVATVVLARCSQLCAGPGTTEGVL
jgi:hypothetical protein